MPSFSNAPKEMNNLMEEVYAGCMRNRGDKTMCSKIAISAAKKAGWRNDNGIWHKMPAKKGK